jgi:protein SCO1/2
MKHLIFLPFLAIILACESTTPKLPFLGNPEKVVGNDTIYPSIPDFSFTNQDGRVIRGADVKGKVYVAEFFFTSCPSICPKMLKQMKRVSEKFGDRDDFRILSFSIDPVRDSVGTLAEYGKRAKINSNHWWMLTGNEDSIYNLGENHFMSHMVVDENEPGGYVHSGFFILVDRNGHKRGAYDGTDPKDVERLMKELPRLLEEK